MSALERILIDFFLIFVSREDLNGFFRDPQHTATLIGVFIALAGALLGTFLLLRGMALTTDAISHTVLLGIVVAFLLMTRVFGAEPNLSSPWLIIGAAGAGVATVVLTEFIQRSGLVRQDAALGLAFPLLFAVSIIPVSRYVEDAHLDEDAVMAGEIGIAWANTNSYCLANCDPVIITPDDPRAEVTRECINCTAQGLNPRDPAAEFRESCRNCEAYTPAQAIQLGLFPPGAPAPELVFWPQAITVTGLMALLTVAFVALLYKELKLTAFDPALAMALGFRPGMLHYATMIFVSLVAVGAFDAVGSILVIAFFIIPPAAAYLLTDRLAAMLGLGALIGAASAYWGYDLARGSLFGVVQVSDILAGLNRALGLGLEETWNTSISASIVLMMFGFFVLAWVASPQYGLVSSVVRRARQRQRFDAFVVLGHILHHQDMPDAAVHLQLDHLPDEFHWPRGKVRRVMARLRAEGLVRLADGQVRMTPKGAERLAAFQRRALAHTPAADAPS